MRAGRRCVFIFRPWRAEWVSFVMKATDVIRGLGDPSPCFVCENLTDRQSKARYYVPVGHVKLRNYMCGPNPSAGQAALEALPDLGSVQQLKAIVSDSKGLGLWASQRLLDYPGTHHPDAQERQAAAGSLIIYPPAEWAEALDDIADWQFDGVEALFEGLPYTFDDVIPFAGVNFTPDRWLLVLRGPMAGNVCWWTHDGDSVMDKPWALDVRGWADRIFADGPQDTFSGAIRFTAADSINAAPENAELYPVQYLPETPSTL